MNKEEKIKIIENIKKSFENKCTKVFTERLKSLYLVGSFVFGKISLDRPDLNFLLVFKDYITPEDYLKIGRICREVVNEFKEQIMIRPEFRPFRYIYPKFKMEDEVILNPIIIDEEQIRNTGVIFGKFFTDGLKHFNKLLFGEDILKTINIGKIIKEDFQQVFIDTLFFELPLTRAPAQYSEEDYDLLLNEALISGKMLSSFGIEIAMSYEELNAKKYLEFITNKEKMIGFYKERYDEETAKKVEKILDVRTNYLKYKKDEEKVKEIFGVALELARIVKFRLFKRLSE